MLLTVDITFICIWHYREVRMPAITIIVLIAFILFTLAANIFILRFMNPANRNKIICPIENCFEIFDDPDEYLDHLKTAHSNYFTIDFKG